MSVGQGVCYVRSCHLNSKTMRKPIFIPTGEVIDITTVIDVPTKTATFCETGDERQVPVPAELIAFPPNMEERRYELAKAFMRNRLANETDLGYIRWHYKEMAQALHTVPSTVIGHNLPDES